MGDPTHPDGSGRVLEAQRERGSSHGSTIPIDRLEGLAPALLSGAGGAAKFGIRRDAGVLAFEGTFRSGVGAGTYIFTPSASFPAELVKRGFARPTPADQYLLARGDIGFAFLDEMTTQRYARPDLSLLVRAAHHGVDLTYLQGDGRAGVSARPARRADQPARSRRVAAIHPRAQRAGTDSSQRRRSHPGTGSRCQPAIRRGVESTRLRQPAARWPDRRARSRHLAGVHPRSASAWLPTDAR